MGWDSISCCAIAKGAKTILLLNRESSRATDSLAKLKELVKDSVTELVPINCDLQDFDSVRKAAEEVNKAAENHGGLDVLCLNAGIMAMPDKRTKDGFDIQMQTNQLSHFLLASLCYDALEKAAENRGEARIVPQSSSARMMVSKPELDFYEKSEPNELGGDR